MFKQSRLSNDVLAAWFEELSFLIDAGLPLVTAIQLLSQSQSQKIFSELLQQIQTELKQGNSLNECLSQHPQYFSPLILQIVQLSEHSGQLSKGLKLIANHLKARQALKKIILRSLSYPAILLSFGLASTLWILTYMVPQFAELFQQQQSELPASSRLIFEFSNFLIQQYDLCLGACVLAGIF